MKIGSVMSRDVQLIKPDDTIRSAAALMKKIDAGPLPVTENDKLVGMITDRDIAIRVVAEVWRTDKMPTRAPRCLGSATTVSVASDDALNNRL